MAWALGPVMNGRARHRARCLRTDRGGPWGGRARVGGTPRGGAAEALPEENAAGSGSGRAVPSSRGEWDGSGEGVREVPMPPSRRGLRLAVPAARRKREAPPL